MRPFCGRAGCRGRDEVAADHHPISGPGRPRANPEHTTLGVVPHAAHGTSSCRRRRRRVAEGVLVLVAKSLSALVRVRPSLHATLRLVEGALWFNPRAPAAVPACTAPRCWQGGCRPTRGPRAPTARWTGGEESGENVTYTSGCWGGRLSELGSEVVWPPPQLTWPPAVPVRG